MSQSPSSAPNSQGLQGLLNPQDSGSRFNAIAFVFRALMARTATAALVQVVSVTNDGADAAVGFVDILPLVNQIDGNGNAVPHGIIHGCPYLRMQGGANAVILDPQAGDLGVAVFASRDSSSVIATKGQANPGSRRMFDWADGLYLGGMLNGVPTQYVAFNATGIQIVSPNQVTVQAPALQINADSAITLTSPITTIVGNASISTGATGTFTTASGNIVTVQDGIVTNID